MRIRADCGQLVPLYALVILVACGATLLLVRMSAVATHRARARTAADAAALAGAAEGRASAVAVAAANGGVLKSYDQYGDDVEVVVRVEDASARSRARRDGGCRSSDQSQQIHFGPCQPTSPG